MNRRESIVALLALGAGLSPAELRAQRAYRIAVMFQGSERALASRLAALRSGLAALGYVEGRNLTLDVRGNEAGIERLPGLATDLMARKPDLFVVAPVRSAEAVHRVTRAVPIVMASGSGAVTLGLARSLAQPGGNVTGITNQGEEVTQKQIELLRAIVPGMRSLGVLTSGQAVSHGESWHAAQQAAEAMQLKLVEVRIGAPGDLDRLASACGNGGCQGLLVMLDPLFVGWRAHIIERVARLRLPAMYFASEFPRDGGLISYAANGDELWRRAASYVDRILRGAKPGELPIEQPTQFELVVNQGTARVLGIKLPQALLARADRVIE